MTVTPCVFYVVRNRESKLPLDELEKLSRHDRSVLAPHKKELLQLANTATMANQRWHLALIVPRLPLTPRERAAASEIMFEYLADPSSLVKTFAMQALVDFALEDRRMLATVVPVIEHLTELGSPAMRARGRKLLKTLRRDQAV